MSALAILHPMTLLGKELRETLGRGAERYDEVRLLSTRADEVGTLTEAAGAAAMVQPYAAESLAGVQTAFFCGPIAASRPLLAELPAGVRAVVLSPDATPEDGRPVVAGVNDAAATADGVLLSPHPAVVLLAHLLHPLAALGPRAAVATGIQPASMHDDPGIEELFEQTRQILTLTPRRPAPVFGAQLAFNLLPIALAAEPITAELATVLAGTPPVALQLLQGSVFHSFAASLFVRFAAAPGVKAVRRALADNPVVELVRKAAHLGPIEAAASEKVLVGEVREAADGLWLWAVMDNLTRGGALNALAVAAAAE
jgi:aspartate-semialdehyde dehydrogenase